MKIKSIKITNLFGIFDYNIAYPTDSNILIITGPNGYGKTQILNIIYSIFNKEFYVLDKLPFSEVSIRTNYGNLTISKGKNESKLTMLFPHHKPIIFKPTDYHGIELCGTIDCKVENWRQALRLKVFFSKFAPYLIKEQRILKIEESYSKEENKKETTVKQQIEIFSKELRQKMMASIDESFELAQSIDSTYPKRLMQEKEKLTKEEYENRLKVVIEKQKQLKEIGLFENEHEELEYSEDDAKALTVYLKDLEQKTTIFDKLLAKIDLFMEIVNERGFAFKELEIDKKAGLTFKNHKGESIQIDQLSSGEKNKIALYYELIFNAKSNSLVLIDEPEISLHVSWQKEFLSDLEKIIALHEGMQTIVATHSPTIISDRWDWVHNLELKKEIING